MIYVLSGSPSLYAVIAVTYPAGSICTCGGKAAKDTSGYALFNVKPGTYTVECHTSDNSKSKSTSVTVAESDKGKSVSVNLSYELVLFDNGNLLDGLTFTGFGKGGGNLTFSHSNSSGYGDSGTAYSNSSIEMTGYSTIHFTIASLTLTGYASLDIGISDSKNGDFTNKVSVTSNVSNATKSVDIASKSSGFIKATLSARSGTSTVKISKIWLE